MTTTATITRTATVTTTATITRTATLTTTATLTRTATLTTTATLTRTQTITATPTVTVTLESPDADIDPVLGGQLSVEKGTIVVQFPPGAVSSRLRVHFERPKTDVAKEDRTHQQVLNRFSLRAFDRSDPSKEVKEFKKAIKIIVRYDPRMLPGWKEQNLGLVYWDTAKKRWLPLASTVDPKLHTVTALTNHFTDLGLTEAPYTSFLPTLQGFQTDLFTGAAGSSLALDVPPGRGGLAPKLTLEYSSGGVDMMGSSQQASFVGAGWRLGENYIGRDNRTNGDPSDDLYLLVLNGMGYDLVLGVDGFYHTASEQYWRISNDVANDRWLVITNDGTQHQFGYSPNSRAVREWPNGSGGWYPETYAWWLGQVVDTHNNQVTYSYLHDTNVPNLAVCWQTPVPSMDRGVYPQLIQYNGGLTQIAFFYSTRVDYNLNVTSNCIPFPSQTQKLDRVDISTSVGGAMQLVRRYTFTYDYSTFPGVYFDHGDGTGGGAGRLTLRSLTHYGTDGQTSLPPYTFTYENNRLKMVDNGIGGKTTFAYETVVAGAPPDGVWIEGVSCPPGSGVGCNPNWGVVNAFTNDGLWDGQSFMWVIATSAPAYAYRNLGSVVPGATYYFFVGVGSCCDPRSVRLSVFDGVTETFLTDWFYAIPDYGTAQIGGLFTTRDGGGSLELRVYTQNQAPVHYIGSQLYNTRHRVTAKTIDDGNGTVGTYSYAYDSIAVNDNTHSEDAKGSNPRHPKGWEFRGHAAVTVTDPAGNKTQNFFYQDDLFKGRAHQIVQLDSSNKKYSRILNTFDSRCIPAIVWIGSTQSTDNCTRMPTLKPISFANFDGDLKHDIAAFRPDMGLWTFLKSSSNFSSSSSYAWGIGTDIPVPGDYDGDGKTDIAVFRPSNVTWYILTSSSNFASSLTYAWGVSTDIPVPGDYDGDGKTNIAVFRPSNGTWYIATSAPTGTYTWGQSGDIPVPGDYDGDRKTDIAVWRPSNGTWYILTSSSNFSSSLTYAWGVSTDVPVPGDYDGDGMTNIAVFRPGNGTWYIASSSTLTYAYGMGNTPAPADYDGDRKTDIAVYDPSNGLWSVLTSSSGFTSSSYYRLPGAPFGLSNFTYLASTTRETYEGQATPKSQMTEYTYDSYGNAQWIIEHDNTGAVYRKTLRTFYSNTSPWILNNLALVQVFDGNNVRLSETRYFYDGSVSYTSPPTKGDLTRVDATADGINFFTNLTNTYDTYGNVKTATDALNHTTSTNYDTTYNIFPTSVTNALNQTTTNTYDYRFGKLASTTDPNNATTSYAYDVFGRTKQIWAPNEQTYAPTAQYTYTLTAPRPLVQVQARRDLGGANAAVYQNAWWFYDGLGRVIQRQTQGLNNSLILANTVYNNLGQLYRTSNPYAVTASGGTYQTPNWAQPFTEHQYDPIGRENLTINPDGTQIIQNWLIDNNTTLGYTPTFEQVHGIADANLHAKHFVNDVFGRTFKVREFTGTCYSNCAPGTRWAVYAETTYEYDVLNHLTKVTDAAGNQTTLTYDWLGRKTAMTDPDMGSWGYGYDNVGNLTRQTDAKSQTTCLYYDALNRLKGKNYRNDTACPADPGSGYTVWDKYDEATSTNGKGRRTSMADPSGSSIWNYDKQGRVTSTAKSIIGAPTASYTTSWTYDAMNRARSMTYPDGEVVPMTYNDQGLLATLGSYVTNSNYNAAGELLSMNLGNGATTSNTYNAQNLRLTLLQTMAGATTLQNLSYQYDNVGNVKTITDTVRSETSTFGYDDLNRLLNASITGVYSQGWGYNSIGNIITSTLNSVTSNYTYDPNHKHAATAMGSNAYAYDANGSMITRTIGSSTYFQTWDPENRLSAVISDTASLHLHYNGDSQRVRKTEYALQTPLLIDTFDSANTTMWTYSISQTVPFNDGGQNVVKSVGTGVSYDTNFYRNANLTNGQSASIDFKVDGADTFMHLSLESYDGGTYSRWGVVAGWGGPVYAQYNDNNTGWQYALLVNPVKLNTWYRLTLRVDDVNGFKVEVRERDGGTTGGSFSYRMTGGKQWRFHHWIYRNTAYLDNYVERTDSSRTTYYIGNHYEVSAPPTTTTKYYYFGAQRVAMKQDTAVTYLHGDHLGSTSVAVGATISTQVYYPFGAVRASTGTLPTDFTFTGQKLDASDGLMYYGARYYDAALGRFISADTIVPGAGNPQNLNRYAYVQNNPVRYTDPTGHRACGGPEDLDCDTPSGVGTPGECDLSCVEPPAVTQGSTGPNSDACNIARCGGSDSSASQTQLGQGPTPTPTPPGGTPTAPQTGRKQTPPPNTTGLIITAGLLVVGGVVADVSLVGLGIILLDLGPVGVAIDLLIVAPAEYVLINSEVSIVLNIHQTISTGEQKPVEFVFPMPKVP